MIYIFFSLSLIPVWFILFFCFFFLLCFFLKLYRNSWSVFYANDKSTTLIQGQQSTISTSKCYYRYLRRGGVTVFFLMYNSLVLVFWSSRQTICEEVLKQQNRSKLKHFLTDFNQSHRNIKIIFAYMQCSYKNIQRDRMNDKRSILIRRVVSLK